MEKVREIFAEFDLVYHGYASGYFYGRNLQDCKNQITEELKLWGGGHADIFDEDGEFIDDIEV